MQPTLVDPALCRPWHMHNRRLAHLTRRSCADLIDSIRRQGRQEVPAIVRPSGDPAQPYDIICGARRHFAVSTLRAAGLDIGFLIEQRDLGDAAAFVIADLENRNRRDLTAYERATDYARALGLLYGGRQRAMARDLQVSTSWLSRYLTLAALPPEILTAFADTDRLRTHHAARLGPMLRDPDRRPVLIEAAEMISLEQAVHAQFGRNSMPVPTILKRLVASTITEAPPTPQFGDEICNPAGEFLVAGAWRLGTPLTLTIPDPGLAKHAEILAGIAHLLTRFVNNFVAG